jgi:hypothetical protein
MANGVWPDEEPNRTEMFRILHLPSAISHTPSALRRGTYPLLSLADRVHSVTNKGDS